MNLFTNFREKKEIFLKKKRPDKQVLKDNINHRQSIRKMSSLFFPPPVDRCKQ